MECGASAPLCFLFGMGVSCEAGVFCLDSVKPAPVPKAALSSVGGSGAESAALHSAASAHGGRRHDAGPPVRLRRNGPAPLARAGVVGLQPTIQERGVRNPARRAGLTNGGPLARASGSTGRFAGCEQVGRASRSAGQRPAIRQPGATRRESIPPVNTMRAEGPPPRRAGPGESYGCRAFSPVGCLVVQVPGALPLAGECCAVGARGPPAVSPVRPGRSRPRPARTEARRAQPVAVGSAQPWRYSRWRYWLSSG
jgi:hypothetical protein